MAWQPGQQLQKGKYTIERELGREFFWITYRAKRSDGQRWVIKTLNPEALANLSQEDRARLETMFLNEAVKLTRCTGAHIVKMDDPFYEGTIACLPTEYLEGGSLADRAQPILPEAEALNYIRQIGAALTIVHGQGLVHRNVCPANLFLRIQDGKTAAVLTNFSLALEFDAELTRTRKTECLDGFSPIELYGRGQPVGAYTDIYSLAATLYELLTGELPVSAEERKLGNRELVLPMKQKISEKTVAAIVAGMKLKPKDRPPSVQAWLEMLEPQLSPPPQPEIEEPQIPSPSPRSEVWAMWQAIGTLLGVVATVMVGLLTVWLSWLLLNKPEPQPTPQASPTVKVTPK
jgi:serine/threonine protein kinase